MEKLNADSAFERLKAAGQIRFQILSDEYDNAKTVDERTIIGNK